MSKKWILVAAVLVGAFFIESGIGAKEKITLIHWHFGGIQPEHDWVTEMDKKWNAENPHIQIKRVFQDWATKRERMISAFTRKALPDTICLDTPSIPDFVRIGILRPLDEVNSEMVKSWEPRFVPEIWNTVIYEGHVYAVPTYVDMATMMGYNTRMFAEMGLLPPTTWDELKEVARKFKARGIAGIIIPGAGTTNDVNIFEGMVWANGGRWLSEDGKKVVINGPGGVDVMQLWADLYNERLAPEAAIETDYYEAILAFFQNQGAMALGMSWIPAIEGEVATAPGFQYRLTLAPRNPKPSGNFSPASTIMAPTTAFMLTTGCKHPEAAMEYLNFVASQEFQQGWDGDPIPGRVPATKANWESPDLLKCYPDLVPLYRRGELFKGSLPMPAFPGLIQMEVELGKAIQSVLLGEISAKEALDKVAEKSQKILEKVSK